ncbi:hypothetical protein [Rhizobium sp. TRM95796]|uniref:hypothetical protein n=1 Tax=Rhizobium sp. TRM95796 TaxID=2979862 RepID=UPI0021E80B00|nr:hypothetical protein [Rhizobium sp. TRM95796]MCV3764332.1 hypothetical protein [Rhizobium sp. TRM95796]
MKKLLILSSVAITTIMSMSVAGRADDVLDEYNAYIGEDDLYNSNGERLREPWQIIRQDRANFHKYRVRQSGDESDSYFSSVDNRAAAERMVRSGTITREARRLLLNGDVMINVKVMEGDDGVYLKINVE